MNEGLKLVLLLFHRAGKKIQNKNKTKTKQKKTIKFSYIVFFSTGAALRSAEDQPRPRTNGMVRLLSKKRQQQQAVVRTAQGLTLSRAQNDGLIPHSFSLLLHPQDAFCYLLPLGNVQTSQKIFNTTLRLQHKNQERLSKLCVLVLLTSKCTYCIVAPS